jgi:hypothetical protein
MKLQVMHNSVPKEKEEIDMSKAREIASGYKNLLKNQLGLSSPEQEKLFVVRREICNACDYRSALDVCIKCGCPLSAKTKSLSPHSKCPEGLW